MRNEVVEALAIRSGEAIADIGCGPCYFTIPIARETGPQGTVWAVDIEPRMLQRCQEHIEKADLTNIKLVHCTPDDPHLPDGQIDTVLIVNTYHHIQNRPDYLAKLKRALVPGGRVVIIDFIPKSQQERGFGPPLERQLSKLTVEREFHAAGFSRSKSHEFLPEQYFIEFRTQPVRQDRRDTTSGNH